MNIEEKEIPENAEKLISDPKEIIDADGAQKPDQEVKPVVPVTPSASIPAETAEIQTPIAGEPPVSELFSQQPNPPPVEPEKPKAPVGRPPGSKNKFKPRADFSDVLGTTLDAKGTDYTALSGTLFDMTAGTLTMIFGSEWQPRNPDEKKMVVDPLAVYLKSKGMDDLPPGYVLAFVCIAYCAPRFRAPTTQAKLSVAWQWLKNKIGGFFRRRKGMFPQPTDNKNETN